jgi:phosphatidylglycerol:prolipoprotein diacylglycerol transferase
MLPMLDVAVLGFLIGQSVGRWGNLVNQEAFGRNTDSIFGMTGGRIQAAIMNSTEYFDGAAKAADLSALHTVHPCFLYESAWCLLGFLILSFWSKRRKYDGQLLLMYLAWYGAERFIVEGLRTDSLMIGNIRISQALSALLAITSIILQIIMFFRVRRDPDRYKLYANTGEARLMLEESRRKKVVISPLDSAVLSDRDDEIGILPDEEEDTPNTILGDAADEVKDKAEDAAEAVRDKAEDAAEAVKDKAEDAAEAVKDKAEDVAEAVRDKAEDAAEAVRDKAEDAVEAVKEKAEDAAEAVRDKAEDAVEAVRDKAEDAAEVLTGVVEGVVEDAEDKTEEFAEDIGDDVKEITEEAEKVAETVKEEVEEAAEEVVDKAEDAAGAIKDKAEDTAEEAAEKAEEAAGAVEDAADKAEDKYEHLAEKHDEKLTGGSGKQHSKKKKHRR